MAVAAMSGRRMKPAGLISAVLALIGMVASTALRPEVARPVRTWGNERILAVDLHVHPFPGDGALLPWDLAREAHRRALDAIAITAHNQMIGINGTGAGPTPFGVLLLPGEEVTMPDVHIAAIGLTRPIGWRGTVDEIAAAIHAQGGVAIAAHPAEAERQAWMDAGFRAMDGVEVAHPTMYASPRDRADLRSAYAQARRDHPGIAAIGSSDDHTAEPIGLCRTYVFVDAVTTTGILDAIRRGRTVACDGGGVAIGPAPLRAAAADACRADAAAGEHTPGWPRLATGLAWLGLVGLAFVSFP
jgi:hypothetical protein